MERRCDICRSVTSGEGACEVCGYDPAVGVVGAEGWRPPPVTHGGDDVIVGTGEVAQTIKANHKTKEINVLALKDLFHDDEVEDDFLSATTSGGVRVVIPAAVHVDARTGDLLEPEVVLGRAAGGDLKNLTIFEKVVYELVDGARPNQRIAAKSGLSINDLQIALALLINRGALELVGRAERRAIPLNESAIVELPFVDAGPAPDFMEPTLPVAGEDGLYIPDPPRPMIGPPPPEAILYDYAREAEDAGEFARAVDLLRAAVKINPNVAPLYNRMGVLLATRLGKRKEGRAAIRRALELEPENITYVGNLERIPPEER